MNMDIKNKKNRHQISKLLLMIFVFVFFMFIGIKHAFALTLNSATSTCGGNNQQINTFTWYASPGAYYYKVSRYDFGIGGWVDAPNGIVYAPTTSYTETRPHNTTDYYTVSATDRYGNTVWAPGSDYWRIAPGIYCPQPVGFHDGNSGSVNSAGCNANGWTCDANNYSQALRVDFYADTTAPSGYIGNTTANGLREPAVGSQCGGNRNHGFSFNLPNSLKDGNPHTIYAYAINIYSGYNPLLSGTPKTITCCKKISFVSGSYTPSEVAPGQTFNVKCDYGLQTNNIGPSVGGVTGCSYTGFSGNTANFTCTAGSTYGTYPLACSTFNQGDNRFCEGEYNLLGNVKISPPPGSFALNPVTTSCNGDQIQKNDLSWTVSANANIYYVYRGTDSGWLPLGTTTGTTWTENRPHQTSEPYIVMAGNNTGQYATSNYNYSASKNCYTPPGPFTLNPISSSCNGDTVQKNDLSWSVSSRANIYYVYRGTGSGWQYLGATAGTTWSENRPHQTSEPYLVMAGNNSTEYATSNYNYSASKYCIPNCNILATSISTCTSPTQRNTINWEVPYGTFTSFTIQSNLPDGNWENIGSVVGTARTYTDANQPQTEQVYRIVANPTNAVCGTFTTTANTCSIVAPYECGITPGDRIIKGLFMSKNINFEKQQ